MFDLGWPEMLVIAIVLIVVVGPKDLPRMLRSFGRTTAKLRSMAGDFRKQFDEALKEAELDDVKATIDSARKLNPAADIKKALNPLEKAATDVKAGLDQMMKPAAPKVAQTSEPAEAGDAAAPADAAASKSEPAKAAARARPAAAAKKASGAKASKAKSSTGAKTKTSGAAR